jgi:predicted metal-dependent hydrolase
MTTARWPAGFAEGVRSFNAGRYFEAHEAFEGLLDAVEADQRWELLVALVQVAVGYHKWTAGHPGAARMLGLGLDKLAAFPDEAWGIDIEGLRARVAEDRALAERGVPPAGRPRLLLRPPRGPGGAPRMDTQTAKR